MFEKIDKRLVEIRSQLESNAPELDLGALEKEVEELTQKRAALVAEAEKRSALLNSLANGTEPAAVTRSFPTPTQSVTPVEQRSTSVYATTEYRSAFRDFITRGVPIPAEYRANEMTKTTDAGAVIPETIMSRIIEKMENVGNIWAKVTKTNLRGGVSYPTSKVKPVATWVTEGGKADRQKKSVDKITFTYHKLSCPVSVSFMLDTVSLDMFEAQITTNIVEAMIKAMESAIIAGTGTNQPKGLLTSTPPEGQALTITAAPTWETLVDTLAKLPSAYVSGASWIMSQTMFFHYYGLQDETGQPIARVNYGIEAAPQYVLLGLPVDISDEMPNYTADIEAGKVITMLFKLADYVVNTNYDMTIRKYIDDESDEVVQKGLMLTDGKPIDLNSLVTLTTAAAPAGS